MPDAAARRPLIIAGVVVLLAVVAFGLGAGLGGGGSGGAASWQRRLAGVGAGRALPAGDVSVAGTCQLQDGVVLGSGGCTLTVSSRGGAFGLGAATRKGRLADVGTVDVVVTTTVQGTTVSTTLHPSGAPKDTGADLTFGRSGGTVTVACQGLGGQCAVRFPG